MARVVSLIHLGEDGLDKVFKLNSLDKSGILILKP